MAKYKTAFCPLCGTPNPKHAVMIGDGTIVCPTCAAFSAVSQSIPLSVLSACKEQQTIRLPRFRRSRVLKYAGSKNPDINIDDTNKLFWAGTSKETMPHVYGFEEVAGWKYTYPFDRVEQISVKTGYNRVSTVSQEHTGRIKELHVTLSAVEGPIEITFPNLPRKNVEFENFFNMCMIYRKQVEEKQLAEQEAEARRRREEEMKRAAEEQSKAAAGDRLVSDKATEDLVRYNELLYAGIITEEQFEEIKKRIIGI